MKNSETITYYDIATDYRLWFDYFDNSGKYTEEVFDNMSNKKKVDLLIKALGQPKITEYTEICLYNAFKFGTPLNNKTGRVRVIDDYELDEIEGVCVWDGESFYFDIDKVKEAAKRIGMRAKLMVEYDSFNNPEHFVVLVDKSSKIQM